MISLSARRGGVCAVPTLICPAQFCEHLHSPTQQYACDAPIQTTRLDRGQITMQNGVCGKSPVSWRTARYRRRDGAPPHETLSIPAPKLIWTSRWHPLGLVILASSMKNSYIKAGHPATNSSLFKGLAARLSLGHDGAESTSRQLLTSCIGRKCPGQRVSCQPFAQKRGQQKTGFDRRKISRQSRAVVHEGDATAVVAIDRMRAPFVTP